MGIIKKSLKLCVFIVLFSCTSNKKYIALSNDISRCIEERVKQDPIYIENFNLKTFFEEFELIMIDNNLLEGNSKNDYLSLFFKLKNDSIDRSQFKTFITKVKRINNYELIQNSININNTPFECNRFLIEKSNLQLNSELSDYYNIITSFFQNGTIRNNWEINIKMLKSIPLKLFDNINYKLPIMVLAYDNLLSFEVSNSVK